MLKTLQTSVGKTVINHLMEQWFFLVNLIKSQLPMSPVFYHRFKEMEDKTYSIVF